MITLVSLKEIRSGSARAEQLCVANRQTTFDNMNSPLGRFGSQATLLEEMSVGPTLRIPMTRQVVARVVVRWRLTVVLWLCSPGPESSSAGRGG